MAKKNTVTVPKITHLEVICFAIQHAQQKYLEAKEMLQHIGSKDENPWKCKLKALCDLYRIEAGSDYGLDIELD